MPPNSSALRVRRDDDPASSGRAAAADAADALRDALAANGAARVVFAAAPSQRHLLHHLAEQPGIDWARVTAFHMDEYIGLAPGSPQRLGNWLRAAFCDRVPLGAVHLIEPGDAPQTAAREYARLLGQAPIDLVCLGIGVNGHLAFNDPPVADLADPDAVKVVELDETSRRQQVEEGCFPGLDAVPRQALTLTIPRLLSAGRLVAVVSGRHKREAVRRTLQDPVGVACPSTALRTHPYCTLHLDADAASALPPEPAHAG
ncbi:6-phosphogluconolactonase [Dactylosporangium sp. CA-233914]|uniref:6-phosphogluconolactonase n=1 Tax=Dactylosporangium sp. CA-233914 TaxID=3239934 RepID=UPI003D8C560E